MVTSRAVVLRLPPIPLLVVLLVASVATAARVAGAEDAPPPPVVRTGVTGCKRIALTFDLCPVRDPHGFDDRLVELLVTTRTPATFFPSGRWMTKHDDHVAELLAVPFFELGTHGATHAHLKKLNAAGQEEEIASAVKQLADAHGTSAVLFRPPYGEFDATTERVAAALGQKVVLWSAVSGDPVPSVSADRMLATLKPQLRDGTIIVMHANGKGVHTRELVEKLLPAIAAAGLTPVTVGELLKPCPDATPG